jgi:hypothetical protein
MTMHLEGPWLNTIGKKKGKLKFRNAEQAKLARDLEQSWQDLQKKWGVEQSKGKKVSTSNISSNKPTVGIFRRTTVRPPSLDSSHLGAVSSKPSPVYTGDKIIGIGTLHKSNAVPIFSDTEAKEISQMRR